MPEPAQIVVATVALSEVPTAVWPGIKALLSADELARAARFRFEIHAQQYLAAHALKRWMLCDAAGGTPQGWEFGVAPGGKPFVAGGRGPHFNISHCNGMVGCAISADVALGLDLEAVDRIAPFDVAHHCFGPAERAWLFGLPEPLRSPGFFRLWTLKEAFIKATGAGITTGLDTFSIGIDPLRVTFHEAAPAHPDDWQLFQAEIGESHVMGLAWQGPAAEVIVKAVSLADLISG